MKNKILLVISILEFIAIIVLAYFNFKINKDTASFKEQLDKQIVITNEIKEEVTKTIKAIENKEDISTNEIIESSPEEEQLVTDEGAIEKDALVEQENISYDGTNTGNGLYLLGQYQGLTYYNQADYRWANMMYSSIGNSSQTMKSSACGPTAAAIVVSSSKGAILPTTMAKLFVENGFRTAWSGTAWSAFPFIADYFDFNEYRTTAYFDTAMSYLGQKNDNGNSKYYLIASCGTGLFTTGGHYVVLVSLDGETIQVYDPYLYNGKFNTASRRAAGVVVSGNSAFVSKNSFRQYANYKNFWIFSNDSATQASTNSTESKVNYTRYVSTKSLNLNVRDNANGNIINQLKKGTKVNVVEVQGEWSKIDSPVKGWVSSAYLSASPVNGVNLSNQETNSSSSTNTTNSTVGNTYRLKALTTLYASPVMEGFYYTYLPNTKVQILKNITSNIDYIYIPATGRYAYCYSNAYRINDGQNYINSNTSKYKVLANTTTLYAKPNMKGFYYVYLPNTRVQILQNVSSKVDYIYIPATGRYAYCYNDAYR